jgi:arylsulfatase A-like enzyme
MMKKIFSKNSRHRITWLAAAMVTVVLLAVILTVKFSSHQSEGMLSEQPDILSHLKDYNLIIILIDALRADHLGCYGYHRNTSPFIDSLAKGGMVFGRAMSNSSYTRESVSVLFSGRLPSSGGSGGWNGRPSKKIKNIGILFREAGYKTALLSNSIQVKHPDFKVGFDHAEILSSRWGVSRGGPKLTNRALAFAKKNRDQKFMMYLHYLDPHGPYEPPSEYYLRFSQSTYPHPLSLYKYVRKNCAALIKDGFGPGEARFDDLVLRYDAEIALVDHSVELLFQTLKELNLQRNTLVLITADHGEEFLEHDFVEHAWTLYNESLHIPLILWAPGVVTPQRIDSPVSIVDILPTLLRLMGIPHERNDFDGTPLFRFKENGFYFSPPEKPFIAELLVQHRNLIRAVIKDNWKYIAAQRWLAPAQRPEVLPPRTQEIERNKERHLDIWGPIVHQELYDLSTDPGEKRLLPQSEKGRELKEILTQYRRYCRQHGLKDTHPGAEKRSLSKKEREKLKTLGYL